MIFTTEVSAPYGRYLSEQDTMAFPTQPYSSRVTQSGTSNSICSNCQTMYHQEQASRVYQEQLETKIRQTEASQKNLTDYLAQLEEALSQSRYDNRNLEASLARVGWEKESLLQGFHLERARAKEMELRLAVPLWTESQDANLGGGQDHSGNTRMETQGNTHSTLDQGRLCESISTLRATVESLDATMQQFTEALPNMRDRVSKIQITADDCSRCVS